MHTKLTVPILFFLISVVISARLSAQPYALTVNCPSSQSLTECPEYSFSGPVCLNCHPIAFPTATTECPGAQVEVEFIGSEVLSTPQDTLPLVQPMDTVRTSGLSAFQTVGFGVIVLRFRITDACGNEQTCEYTFENIPVDPVPYYTICPSDITVAISGDQTTATVDFPDPVFQSNCLPFTLNQVVGPASGSDFLIGQNQVLWVASHLLGADFCAFTVTVLPPGAGGDTLCQKIFPVETAEIACASPDANGYALVTWQNGQYTSRHLTNSGELLDATPVSVDSSAQGIFDWIDLFPGSFAAGTEIRKLNADSSVAYTIYQPGSLLGFYRSPCDPDRYIFNTSRISGGGPGGTVIEQFKTEISFGADSATRGYDCATFIQLATQQAAYSHTTGSYPTDDGGRLYFFEKNVTASNDPLHFPLGKTLRVYKNDATGALLWEKYMSPDLPAVGCAQIFERPGEHFLLVAALAPQQQLWTYQSDCSGTAALPDLHMSELVLQNTHLTNGEVLYYHFTLQNTGPAPASGEFTVAAWLSADTILSADDWQDGLITTGNFEAGQTVTQVAGASTIPSDLPPGDYFLLLKVDADSLIEEGDEENNLLVSTAVVNIQGVSSGSAETDKQEEFSIFPNPTRGVLYLNRPETGGQKSLRLTFFNAMGQKVDSHWLEAAAFEGGPVEIRIGALPAGEYWLLLTPSEGRSTVEKLWLLKP